MQKRKKTDNLHLSGNRLRHLVAKGLSFDTPTRTLGQRMDAVLAKIEARSGLAAEVRSLPDGGCTLEVKGVIRGFTGKGEHTRTPGAPLRHNNRIPPGAFAEDGRPSFLPR